jgi:hypothetical protein
MRLATIKKTPWYGSRQPGLCRWGGLPLALITMTVEELLKRRFCGETENMGGACRSLAR